VESLLAFDHERDPHHILRVAQTVGLDVMVDVVRIVRMSRTNPPAAEANPSRVSAATDRRPPGLPASPAVGPGGSADRLAEAPLAADVAGLIADLRSALAELKCLGSERLRRRGVSMGHLHAMALLEGHGRLSMSRLAELLDVSLSNATGLVDRMAERGLVERIRVPDDRRVVLVELTDLGRRLLEELDLLREDLLVRVLAGLEPDQLAALAAAVARLRDGVRSLAAEVRAEARVEAPTRTD
jgi:DNA-binding MarR family transcriptional regulator